MIWRTQDESSFEDVERRDLSNLILFRQWERRSLPGFRDVPFVATAAMALLLIAVVGVWVVSQHPDWAIFIFAMGAMVIGYVILHRRSLRFNSLIIAKEFIIWETQCSPTWKHLRRPSQFGGLDLPFKLKDRPLIIPIDEITNWSIEDDEQLGGNGRLTARIVLWRGTFVIPTFFVSSRDRATSLIKAIRMAVERMNSGEVGHQPWRQEA